MESWNKNNATWSNLEGTDLINALADKCGKKPSLTDAKYTVVVNSGLTTKTQQDGGLYNQDVVRHQLCQAQWTPYFKNLKKLVGAQSTTILPTSTTTSGTGGLVIGYKDGHEPQDGATDSATTDSATGMSKNMKYGLIGVGVLVLGFVGYKLLTKKKG